MYRLDIESTVWMDIKSCIEAKKATGCLFKKNTADYVLVWPAAGHTCFDFTLWSAFFKDGLKG